MDLSEILGTFEAITWLSIRIQPTQAPHYALNEGGNSERGSIRPRGKLGGVACER